MKMSAFSVENSEIFGRFAVAARDLKAGEKFFEELPFAVGPKASSICLCLECFCPLNAVNGSRCEKCSWPLCEKCRAEKVRKFHENECEIFYEAKSKFFNLKHSDEVCLQLDCITPLRIIIAKELDPERWTEEVEKMEDHRDKRFESETWKVDEQNVVNYLLKACKLSQKFKVDAELIQKILGILEVNSFEAKSLSGSAVRCLYPRIAMLTHSCVPNTTHSIHPTDNFRFLARATVPITEGSTLFATYTYSLSGTSYRQQHLLSGKFFQCLCNRCKDSSEFGTYFSALKCRKCKSGRVLPLEPLKTCSLWRCDNCSSENSCKNVESLLSAIQCEIDNAKSIEMLEKLLTKYENHLHPNHFMLISIKSALIEMYGRSEGFSLSQLSNGLLQRKVELCCDVLKILNIFEPGMSRSRALVMHDMQLTANFLLMRRLNSKEISQIQYENEISKYNSQMNECTEILSWEDRKIL